ncbi:MAG: hypothetical protein HC919_06330 [Oscillatoriales cyanobacterium SM2_2_1]|nr:hypothetical protein [Oscillatoriales cyanobacterium SM2_2_1]
MPNYQPCTHCGYFAHTVYMVCAVHPHGPEVLPCPDFESAELWQPENPQDFDVLADWFWHPLFTGCCPECRTPFSRFKPPPTHWRCRLCGWEDDTFTQV